MGPSGQECRDSLMISQRSQTWEKVTILKDFPFVIEVRNRKCVADTWVLIQSKIEQQTRINSLCYCSFIIQRSVKLWFCLWCSLSEFRQFYLTKGNRLQLSRLVIDVKYFLCFWLYFWDLLSLPLLLRRRLDVAFWVFVLQRKTAKKILTYKALRCFLLWLRFVWGMDLLHFLNGIL